MKVKTGGRYKSQVCSTEVVVVRAPAGDVDLTCGGHPMVDATAQVDSELDLVDDLAGGNQLGKRLVSAGGDLELLVAKPGAGTLAVGREALVAKDAQPLPSSD